MQMKHHEMHHSFYVHLPRSRWLQLIIIIIDVFTIIIIIIIIIIKPRNMLHKIRDWINFVELFRTFTQILSSIIYPNFTLEEISVYISA